MGAFETLQRGVQENVIIPIQDMLDPSRKQQPVIDGHTRHMHDLRPQVAEPKHPWVIPENRKDIYDSLRPGVMEVERFGHTGQSLLSVFAQSSRKQYGSEIPTPFQHLILCLGNPSWGWGYYQAQARNI